MVSPMNDERRGYWREQMEAAFSFMSRAREAPVAECGEPLEPLPDAARAAGVEVEFSATPLADGHPRIFALRRGLIRKFVDAARAMSERGWILKVEDGYRSRAMQKALALKPAVFDRVLKKIIWELEGQTPSPEFLFRRLTVLVATAPKIGTHMSGSAIDLSVLDRKSRAEIDRGGPYLEMSELTPMASPFISDAAKRNRAEITRLMEAQGFVAYPFEFWHYSAGDVYVELLANSNKPAKYGPIDWDPEARSVKPIENPVAPLSTEAEIRAHIEAAFKRIGL
jgi:D-alanyl-D-alanine dipeptidase